MRAEDMRAEDMRAEDMRSEEMRAEDMRAEDRVVVFGRAPRPGHTKTRLVSALGADGAAALYAAFLEDTLAKTRALSGFVPELWVAGEGDRAAFESGPDEVQALGRSLALRVQIQADLGARMAHALEDALERAERVLLIGSDAPTLPPAHLLAAREALEGSADVVFGPSADGGYYLVGVRSSSFDFGAAIRWSSRHALSDTLARARALGRRVHLLAPWYDVDTPDDLRLLRTHLGLRPNMAPATARRLGLAQASGASFDHEPRAE